MKSKISTKPSNSNPDSQPIISFDGYYAFLSNDFPSWVLFDQILFPSVTTAFQAARSGSPAISKKISLVEDIEEFKNIVMNIKNPKNWN